MQIRCFRFQESGSFQLTDERPTKAWLNDGVFRWLDIDNRNPTLSLRDLLAPFDLDNALLEEIEVQDRGVNVEAFQQALFFRMPRQARVDFADPYIPVVCVGNTVISVHRGLPLTPEQITGKLVRLGLTESTTLSNFVLYILMAITNWDIKFYQETRHAIDELPKSFDQRPTTEVLDDIRDLTHAVARLQSATEDRIILTSSLLTLKSHSFD